MIYISLKEQGWEHNRSEISEGFRNNRNEVIAPDIMEDIVQTNQVFGFHSIAVTKVDGAIATSANLEALSKLDGTPGLLTETAPATFTKRTIQGTTNQISVANGDGVAGNPTIALATTVFRANLATVTAANDLTLGGQQNIVNGNTQINAITTAGWTAGSIVYLIFTGTPTVKHNTAGGAGTAKIFLDGSADLAAANNTVLGLLYDGTQWQQFSLKAA